MRIPTPNKQKAIRSTFARLGMHATARQVVDELACFEVEVREAFVCKVKEQIRREDSRALAERSKQQPKDKSRKCPQQRKIPQRRG